MSKISDKSTSQWSTEEISAKLGISTAIYQKIRLGAEQIAEIRSAGVKRIEILLKPSHFDCHDSAQVKEILDECRKQDVKIVSVHGRLHIPYKSEDEKDKEFVLRESLAGIQFAEKAGASIYVAHFANMEHSKQLVRDLLSRTDGYRVKLTTENMGAIPPYMKTVDEINSDRFGITVDIGHPRDDDGINPFVKAERAYQALAQCGHRVFHTHLHETFKLDKKPDHRAPMHEDGIIQWGELFRALHHIDYKGELLFEDGRGENPEEWLQMTADFPQAFVKQYVKGAGTPLLK
jgi:sugar phosphate isomerase/epimerase